MAANFETGFSANGIVPWHGLGQIIEASPTSDDAIKIAGLDWEVKPMPIYDGFGHELTGYKVNTRMSDMKPLGIVTDRYKVVQNAEAFAFTDALLGNGVRYETAGSLASGKTVWMLARMEGTTLAEEDIDPYLVFTNSHDGKGAVRVAITPVRVVCQNTLNLALAQASRHWTCVHKGNIQDKLDEAYMTLSNAELYMKALEEEFGELKLKTVSDQKVKEMTDKLLELEFTALFNKAVKKGKVIQLKEEIKRQKYEEKLSRKRNDILTIYHEKPDLVGTEKSAFRFVNAVSDYATHTTDHKNTVNYQENLFMRTADGHPLIDTAYQLALAV
jgi:phage/plasmid-like protein (TIGR03299 family)